MELLLGLAVAKLLHMDIVTLVHHIKYVPSSLHQFSDYQNILYEKFKDVKGLSKQH